jgi:hypothetical protein
VSDTDTDGAGGMKFKSELAKEAYEEITKVYEELKDYLNEKTKDLAKNMTAAERLKQCEYANKTAAEIVARAIEVAAKIEIEEARYTLKSGDLELTKVKRECEHDWVSAADYLGKPGRYCTICFAHEQKS